MRVGLALGLIGLALAGCGRTASRAALPEPPVVASAEDPFDDRLSAKAGRLEGRIVEAVGPEAGKPQVRRYLLTDSALPTSWRAKYDSKAQADGWTPLTTLHSALRPGEQAFGYARGAERFVITWIVDGPNRVGLATLRFDPAR